MMKKFLLGTAIAMVLATASYAQTYTADDATQAAKGLADPPGQDPGYPNDLLNGVPATFDTPDGRFADAWDLYKLVENYECRDLTVELAILALTEDLEWIGNYLANGDGPVLEASYSRPKTKSEYDGIKIFLAILKDKPACATPDTSTPAIPGNTLQPRPQDPDEPPGTFFCLTTANDIIHLLKLDRGAVVQQTPPPRWKQQTIGDKCVWYLQYYTINDRLEGGWNIMHTDVPCTDPPPGSSAHKDPGSDGGVGGQYCPPPSDGTGLYSPSGGGTKSQVARSTPTDPKNSVEIAMPSQPWWFRSVTPPGASDQLFENKPDFGGDLPALTDPKTYEQPPKAEDKTSEKSAPNKSSETASGTDQESQSTKGQSESKPNGGAEKSDLKPNGDSKESVSKPTGNTDKSTAKPNSTTEQPNAKSAGAVERTNAKSEVSSEHTGRAVANEKPAISQHFAHVTEAGHVNGMHEAGTQMGGMHLGGFRGLGGMHLGGFGGMLLSGFGRR